MSEAVGTWYSQRRNDVAIFTPGCWERARFLEFLVEVEESYLGVLTEEQPGERDEFDRAR